MSIPTFEHLFGTPWRHFIRMLWPTSFQDEGRAELVRLDEELRQRQARLLKCRQKIEKLHYLLARLERRLEPLASMREGAAEKGAGGQWMADQLRRRLQASERVYEQRRARFQLRKQKRIEISNLLLSPLRRRTWIDEDEHDCDSPYQA